MIDRIRFIGPPIKAQNESLPWEWSNNILIRGEDAIRDGRIDEAIGKIEAMFECVVASERSNEYTHWGRDYFYQTIVALDPAEIVAFLDRVRRVSGNPRPVLIWRMLDKVHAIGFKTADSVETCYAYRTRVAVPEAYENVLQTIRLLEVEQRVAALELLPGFVRMTCAPDEPTVLVGELRVGFVWSGIYSHDLNLFIADEYLDRHSNDEIYEAIKERRKAKPTVGPPFPAMRLLPPTLTRMPVDG